MPQVVQSDAGEPGGGSSGPPAPVDRVVVERLVADREQPRFLGALAEVIANMMGEDADELVGQVDGSLRAVLGCAEDVRRSLALQLPGDRQLAARKVEVAERDSGKVPSRACDPKLAVGPRVGLVRIDDPCQYLATP